MKSILISIKPQWVSKILSGEKTIEVRKTAPKCELPIEVYIYCTKGEPNLWLPYDFGLEGYASQPYLSDKPLYEIDDKMNGKVVAKFTLREVTQYITGNNASKDSGYMFGDAEREGVYEKACLTESDIDRYCPDETFYAWHIEDLFIFNEPKELDEFDYPNPSGTRYVGQRSLNGLPSKKHPPQSWFYVEERK